MCSLINLSTHNHTTLDTTGSGRMQYGQLVTGIARAETYAGLHLTGFDPGDNGVNMSKYLPPHPPCLLAFYESVRATITLQQAP